MRQFSLRSSPDTDHRRCLVEVDHAASHGSDDGARRGTPSAAGRQPWRRRRWLIVSSSIRTMTSPRRCFRSLGANASQGVQSTSASGFATLATGGDVVPISNRSQRMQCAGGMGRDAPGSTKPQVRSCTGGNADGGVRSRAVAAPAFGSDPGHGCRWLIQPLAYVFALG